MRFTHSNELHCGFECCDAQLWACPAASSLQLMNCTYDEHVDCRNISNSHITYDSIIIILVLQ